MMALATKNAVKILMQTCLNNSLRVFLPLSPFLVCVYLLPPSSLVVC